MNMTKRKWFNPCDRLNDIIHDINNLLDRDNKGNSAMVFMDSTMVRLLLDAIKEIKNIENEHKLQRLNIALVLKILALNRLYSKTRRRIYTTMSELVDQYSLCSHTKAMITDEEVEYLTTLLSDSNDRESRESIKDKVQATNRIPSKVSRIMRDGLKDLMDLYDVILMKGEGILARLKFIPENIFELLIVSLREYSLKNYEQTEYNLMREAQKYKSARNTHISSDVWGEMIANENRILQLAVSGNLTKGDNKDDYHIDDFTKEQCLQMEANKPLIQLFIENSIDDKLFDVDSAFNKGELFSVLSSDNIDLLNYLILRHNIIRCGAFPPLKYKYVQWLNAKPAQTEDAYQIEDLTEEARGWLLRKDTYPKLAKLLNEEVKPYVVSTGTKATWDSVHFLFKLFGIVKQRFSRKDFAILVTQIVPGLGEASTLKSMMEKSGVNFPSTIKDFDIDKASPSVATALKPFYNKFKNL